MDEIKIGIIHLSDIHLKTDTDKITKKMNFLVDALKNKCIELEYILIIITGDIAFSGKNEEYEIAYCIISDLKNELEKYIKKDIDILFAPGNHDCNFEENNSVRDTVIKSILREEIIDDDKIKVCCSIQNNYFKFIKNFENKNLEVIFQDKLISINKYSIREKYIYFIMLNTAWLSGINEEYGRIYFPVDIYKDKLEQCNDGITITFFHHPTKWCHPDAANYLDDKIECISDFILQGHEHVNSEYTKITNDNKVVYIKGAALQESSDQDESSFNTVVINYSTGMYMQNIYNFNNEKYEKSGKNDWINYSEIVRKKKKKFSMNEDNIKFITDIGSNLNHPRKDKLLLNDIFIYPTLEEVNIETGRSDDYTEVLINSSKLVDFNNEYPMIIYGDENSGKTCLAKKIYLDYLDIDCCPIYISSSYIKNKYIDNVNKLVKNLFIEQYSDDDERFNQLDNKRKIIIIDDFDKADIPIKMKKKFLENVISKYKNTILFCNNIFELQDLVSDSNEYMVSSNVKQFRLKKFGHRLRNHLIHKWNIIGCEELDGDNEIIVKDEESLRRMNIMIGKNYIPAVPFYLLTILQAFEVGNEHNFNDSSYGYYYEYLILQTLNKISDKQGDKDAFISFMICLAKKFYYERKKKISSTELEEFHTWFCEKYRVSKTFRSFISFDKFISNMCKANILSFRYDMYQFSYKYIYYYSIGKYFGDNIQKVEVQNEICEIIKKLYVEEYANIVMFIVHHTKNEFILNTLLNCATNIFSDKEFVKLEDDISFINDLQQELPQMIIENIDVYKNREKQLIKLDEENDEDKYIAADKEDDISDKSDNEIDKINELNFSFKTMEILGQILKNYWGSLSGDIREKIGCQLYLVGLRSLRETYEILNEAKDKLLLILKKEIDTKKSKNNDWVEKRARNLLFLFTSFFTKSCIDKISSCIGDDKLSETFNDIERELNVNSVKIINLSIKLEYFGGKFPYSYVEELIKKNENNILATFLIKHMVRNYLYMYKTTYRDKNKIASLINIPTKGIDIHKAKNISVNE
ncbi:metallophosphoesterase [Clostridium botulinum]|nr:metallophosphoesterase [Clostridium botulinum]